MSTQLRFNTGDKAVDANFSQLYFEVMNDRAIYYSTLDIQMELGMRDYAPSNSPATSAMILARGQSLYGQFQMELKEHGNDYYYLRKLQRVLISR